MKKFNTWLNAIIVLIIAIILIDENLGRLHHPDTNNDVYKWTIIVCLSTLFTLILWNLYSYKKQKKTIEKNRIWHY